MVVGASLDYPPFAYMRADFQPDGFDVALIRELGDRLGLEIQLVDIAPEGLADALRSGQVDAAISALTATADGGNGIGFSTPYYVGADAVLARDDMAAGTIRTPAQLAGLRVGVEKGSIYEKWAMDTLVGNGIVARDSLLAYGEIDQAVRDLRTRRVDTVIMDYRPAQAHVLRGGAKVIARGLTDRNYAIAVRSSDLSLSERLNGALTEMAAGGFISGLAGQYLGVQPSEVAPIPTPAPVVYPTATSDAPRPPSTPSNIACTRAMRWIADLTFDARDMSRPPVIAAGRPFGKVWRVKNTGTCPWTPGYQLRFAGGNLPEARMAGDHVAIDRVVQPGEEYDIRASLVAPERGGTYRGVWEMVDAAGRSFGERVHVGVRITDQPSPAPPPTQTPAPGIQFWADRTSISAGERVNISWQVDNVKEVYFYAQGQEWAQNGVVGAETRAVYPATSTVYELRVVAPDGSLILRQLPISVTPGATPQINLFAATPDYQVLVGQCVTLTWDVSGDVSFVRLTANGQAMWEGAPMSGSLQHCPPAQGTYDYRLEAGGAGGNAAAQRVVEAVQPATAPQPTPPGAEGGGIRRFTAEPTRLLLGQCTILTWDFTGEAVTSSRLGRNGAEFLNNLAPQSQAQDCPTGVGRLIYRIEVGTSDGRTLTRDAVVDVDVP
jgi:polar amino acid transport system substrate-binding protein